MKNYAIFLFALLSLTIARSQTITTDSILQLSTCVGGNIVVPYSTSGNFPFGTTFTAQISDAFGQWGNPKDIGSSPINLGVILGKIPKSTTFGFLYRIRVVTNNPQVTGSDSPNTVVITQIAQLNQILVQPTDTICEGDSATLTAINLANSYLWSTGETTQSITVGQTGTYSVTTTDFLGCESDTSADITVKQCIFVGRQQTQEQIEVFPSPSNGKISVRNLPQQSQLCIYNVLGEEVMPETVNRNGDEVNLEIGKPGIYILVVDDIAIRKIVIQ